MKRAVLVVVTMLFMSVSLNAQVATMDDGEDYDIPSYYTTNYYWKVTERLFEKSKIFKVNDEIAKKNSLYALTPGQIYHLKCLYIWGMSNGGDIAESAERWWSEVEDTRVYCEECADYVTIPWRLSSPYMEIKKILNSEGLGDLVGSLGYMELIRGLKEIANNYISEALYTNPSNLNPEEYIYYYRALSDREACKRFCR